MTAAFRQASLPDIGTPFPRRHCPRIASIINVFGHFIKAELKQRWGIAVKAAGLQPGNL